MSELTEALWDCARASFEIPFAAMIVQTWRTYLKEFGDTVEGRDQASIEIHFYNGMKTVSICTCRV